MLNRFLESLIYAFMLVLIIEFSLVTHPYMAASYIILSFVMFAGSFALRDVPFRHFKVFGFVVIGAGFLYMATHLHPFVNETSMKIFKNVMPIPYTPMLDPFYILMGFVGGTLAIVFAYFLYQRKQDTTFPVRTPIFLGAIMLFVALYLIAKACGVYGTTDIFYITHVNTYFGDAGVYPSNIYHPKGLAAILVLMVFPFVLALLACITLMKDRYTVIRVATYMLTLVIVTGIFIDFPTSASFVFPLIGEAGVLVAFSLVVLLLLDLGNVIIPRLPCYSACCKKEEKKTEKKAKKADK